jgi:hypothetical protein
MNLSDAEMRALVRLGYSLALADREEDSEGIHRRDRLSVKLARFQDGIPIERLNEMLEHVPPDAIRDELVAAGLRSSTGRLGVHEALAKEAGG